MARATSSPSATPSSSTDARRSEIRGLGDGGVAGAILRPVVRPCPRAMADAQHNVAYVRHVGELARWTSRVFRVMRVSRVGLDRRPVSCYYYLRIAISDHTRPIRLIVVLCARCADAGPRPINTAQARNPCHVPDRCPAPAWRWRGAHGVGDGLKPSTCSKASVSPTPKPVPRSSIHAGPARSTCSQPPPYLGWMCS